MEETEEKYKKMADRMTDATGELLDHQSTLWALNKEIKSERKRREKAERTVRQLQKDLETERERNPRHRVPDASPQVVKKEESSFDVDV